MFTVGKILLIASVATLVIAGLALAFGKRQPVTGTDQGVLVASTGVNAQSQVTHLTDSDDHKKEVEDSDIPVLLDFHATWCPPCQALSPHIEEVAKQFKGKVKVVKVDVDANPTLKRKYGVRAMPTLVIVLPKGKGQVKSVGYKDLESLKQWIKDNTK